MYEKIFLFPLLLNDNLLASGSFHTLDVQNINARRQRVHIDFRHPLTHRRRAHQPAVQIIQPRLRPLTIGGGDVDALGGGIRKDRVDVGVALERLRAHMVEGTQHGLVCVHLAMAEAHHAAGLRELVVRSREDQRLLHLLRCQRRVGLQQ